MYSSRRGKSKRNGKVGNMRRGISNDLYGSRREKTWGYCGYDWALKLKFATFKRGYSSSAPCFPYCCSLLKPSIHSTRYAIESHWIKGPRWISLNKQYFWPASLY